jgi:hypothetical protein
MLPHRRGLGGGVTGGVSFNTPLVVLVSSPGRRRVGGWEKSEQNQERHDIVFSVDQHEIRSLISATFFAQVSNPGFVRSRAALEMIGIFGKIWSCSF